MSILDLFVKINIRMYEKEVFFKGTRANIFTNRCTRESRHESHLGSSKMNNNEFFKQEQIK